MGKEKFNLWVNKSKWNSIFYEVEFVTWKKKFIKTFELVTRSMKSFYVTGSLRSIS